MDNTPPGRRRRRRRPALPKLNPQCTEDERRRYEEQLLQTPTAQMRLSVRTINTLEDHDIIFAEGLMRLTYNQLTQMTNFGSKTLKEVRAAVRALGLKPPPHWRIPRQSDRATKQPPRGGSAIFEMWG